MNTSKTIPLSIAVIVIVIIGGVFFTKKSDTAVLETTRTTQPQTLVERDTLPVESSVATPNTPQATEVPASVKPTAPAPTTFTLAVVATHNSESDCWSVVNGGVYNLTSWISRHPGGSSKIMSMCGKDASASFNGQHGGDQSPETTLATFKIGTLSQ